MDVPDCRHKIEAAGVGPTAIFLNGSEVPFRRLPNPYRTGDAEIALESIPPQLEARELRWCIKLAWRVRP